ncbi:hypothetical protein ACIQXW_23310 [Lysinibacillus sp. NPDC097162]|uniref:hypothetical protein n=1 Tax=Lysinibacillus sp. NPDC097162 TaxID=3364140 RepID=UPI00380DD34A
MRIEKTNADSVGDAIKSVAKQREIDAIIPGAIIVHRKKGTIGRCARSSFGISVCFAINGGRGQTIGDYPHFVAQHWRLADAEEVRRYFDAD